MKASIIITSLLLISTLALLNRPELEAVPVVETVIDAPVVLDDYSQRVYTLTNEYRTENGMTTLELNQQLVTAAQNKADDLCERDYWAHELPDGREWYVFIRESGYLYSVAGENLGKGFDQPERLIQGWRESPGHKANLDENWTDIGIGYNDCGGKQLTAQAFAR